MQITVKSYHFLFYVFALINANTKFSFFAYLENQPVLWTWNGYGKFGSLFWKVSPEACQGSGTSCGGV